MKSIYSILLCLFVFGGTHAQNNLYVMTFNIRLNTSADSLNAWPYRKDKVASQILFHQAQIVGVQEALHDQMMDLKNLLPSYKYTGVGRDDGKQKGEYSAIFYDTLRLQLLRTETFWLSEQPQVPGSKSWDAAITRIVTWAQFFDKKIKKRFFVFNTHFDHIGQEARKQSAMLLLQKIKAIAGNKPVIITGDFNSKPQDDPIRILTDTTSSYYLVDTKKISRQPHYGPGGTFNAFGPKEIDDEPIDFIFIRNGIRVLQHASLSQTWKGRFSSDHFPVFAVLQLVLQ
jgi:endonuclease/exonuclease/phosphatase family metal-dependent hydrolase